VGVDTADAKTSYAVVVLHYRAPTLMLECVRAVYAQPAQPVQVVVVDNGSAPQDFSELHETFPDVEGVTAASNVGYGAGMRVGLDRLGAADTVLFLTQDCLLDPGATEALLDEMTKHLDVGLAAPVLHRRSDPDRIWSAGGTLGRYSLWTSHLDRPARSDTYDAEWLDGAALLVRRQVFDAVEWDDGYFLYFEDVELSLRARAAGWRTVVVPTAIGRQEPGDLNVYLASRNHIRFVRRNGRRTQLAAAVSRHAVYLVGDVVRSFSNHRRARFRERRRGLVDAFTGDLRLPRHHGGH
jgi:N-acetylglucosaminyl-diphospho-decaprenol L-rhamnosyltransferase